MTDILKEHRVIGIRYTLKVIKNAGLISKGVVCPGQAVEELQKTKFKADTAKRHRNVRKDSSVATLMVNIEKVFGLPAGSVKLVDPGNRVINSKRTVEYIKNIWRE
jgi:hypothetical protein